MQLLYRGYFSLFLSRKQRNWETTGKQREKEEFGKSRKQNAFFLANRGNRMCLSKTEQTECVLLLIMQTYIRRKNRSLTADEMRKLITLRYGSPPTYDAPIMSQGAISKITGVG